MSIESEAIPVESDPELIPPRRQEDRTIVGELIEEAEDSAADKTTVLTAEERRDFAMLMTVGRRVKKITVMDHPVTIQTLKTADEMRIGLFTKEYLESQGFTRAYQVATCAASVTDIDGFPLYQAISDKEDAGAIFKKKVEKLEEYYPIVISQVYQAVIALEREFADLAIKLGKLPG